MSRDQKNMKGMTFFDRWGYLAMNSASTFGVEGTRWLQSAKAPAQTLLNTFGGAGVGLVLCYCFYGHIIPVGKMVNCTMGSLVSNTAITFLCTAIEVLLVKRFKWMILYYQAVVIGGISGFIVFLSTMILDSKPSLDDPCCTFITHGLCGIWGMLAVGIFARVSQHTDQYPPELFFRRTKFHSDLALTSILE